MHWPLIAELVLTVTLSLNPNCRRRIGLLLQVLGFFNRFRWLLWTDLYETFTRRVSIGNGKPRRDFSGCTPLEKKGWGSKNVHYYIATAYKEMGTNQSQSNMLGGGHHVGLPLGVPTFLVLTIFAQTVRLSRLEITMTSNFRGVSNFPSLGR